MDIKEILSKCDHTLLGVNATWAEIKAICDDGMKFKTASVCIPASYVKQAKEYVGDRLAICTVIGFPNGYSTTKVKCLENHQAAWSELNKKTKLASLTEGGGQQSGGGSVLLLIQHSPSQLTLTAPSQRGPRCYEE